MGSANACSLGTTNHTEHPFDVNPEHQRPSPNMRAAPAPKESPMASTDLTDRQTQILEYIDGTIRDRGYPPSVREIGEAVGLTSPSTVHSHLNTLQKLGYLRRDPSKPRAIEVRYDPNSGAVIERAAVTHVPLVGDVAAGTDVLAHENVWVGVLEPGTDSRAFTVA